MGDRANIYVIDDNVEHGIYLYSHWGGKEWTTTDLAAALIKARPRWDDPSYCTRILISNLYMGMHDSETGGGIGTQIGDNEHRLAVVNIPAQVVSYADAGDEKIPTLWKDTMRFDDFVAAMWGAVDA